jgi:hypothetical protein
MLGEEAEVGGHGKRSGVGEGQKTEAQGPGGRARNRGGRRGSWGRRSHRDCYRSEPSLCHGGLVAQLLLFEQFIPRMNFAHP